MVASEPILTNPTEAELAAATEANLHAWFRAMTRLPGSALDESAQLSRHHAFPTNPMFKGVWNGRMADSEVDTAITDSIAWLTGQGAPFAFWWTSNRSGPANLGERLLAHGFAPFEIDAPAMVADMSAMNLYLNPPPNLRIERVTTEALLQQWKQTFVTAYDVPEWAGQAWADATLALGFDRAPWKQYVALLDDEPAAEGMLFCGGGVAGLVALATLPAHRRKGIGSALQLARIRDAQALGYRYAALFASQMGYSAYQKLGFRDTGVRVSRYLWRANS